MTRGCMCRGISFLAFSLVAAPAVSQEPVSFSAGSERPSASSGAFDPAFRVTAQLDILGAGENIVGYETHCAACNPSTNCETFANTGLRDQTGSKYLWGQTRGNLSAPSDGTTDHHVPITVEIWDWHPTDEFRPEDARDFTCVTRLVVQQTATQKYYWTGQDVSESQYPGFPKVKYGTIAVLQVSGLTQ